MGVRRVIMRWIVRTDGGVLTSPALRKVFKDLYLITIGQYTSGGCFDPEKIDPYTTFGRYCSIGRNIRIITANHPMHFKSMHVFFYNHMQNLCDHDLIEHIPLNIGNDVWIGDNAIIMPGVTSIGDGAVIGAGAVVHKSIPPYAVAVGNPARVVRYRFSDGVIRELLQSKWWEKSIEEIIPDIASYQRPFEDLPATGCSEV